MAIAVLLLWLFTAGAGFYLLLTSSLSRFRQAKPAPAPAPTATPTPVTTPAPAATEAGPAGPAKAATVTAPSRREARRAARERFDPPSLVAARNAPMVPGLRSLLEFAHPACGLLGLACWLGFTLVRYRPLAWIGFGLVAVTACAGLAWFAQNLRAARGENFNARLVVVHGAAAAITVTLTALIALTAGLP